MSKEVLAFVFIIIFFLACNAKDEECYPSSCGVISNINCPFHFKSDPASCPCPHNSYIELYCESNQTLVYLDSKKYRVEEISYSEQEIRLVDPDLQRNSCYSLLQSSNDPYPSDIHMELTTTSNNGLVIFVKCSEPVYDSTYIAATNATTTIPCLDQSTASFLYVLIGPRTVSDLQYTCEVIGFAPVQGRLRNESYIEIHRVLRMGFRMRWYLDPPNTDRGYCHSSKTIIKSPYCFFNSAAFITLRDTFRKSIPVIIRVVIARTSIGIICLAVYLIYELRRKHLSMDESIEAFLSNYKSHIPKRYSYWGIRMMTNRFKEKLGQGGFGSVYKGKLPNGHFVAVKMLGKSKGNGQDFINEVATIGRIHHVNIVQLIGFCSEGSKRALIYDFMPNGSLEKYIFSQEGTNSPLSWEKLHEIAMGIACGIEYLHRGCDMQILHFDIKPHNILLDKDFIPKVSDFGLAKFYPTDDSIVSVTAARGTIGYMAPELFYHNIGGVSYKSDVYSFGMMLMEIAGRRKNINAFADKTSQIYFPSWIYDQLEQGANVEFGDATEEEKVMAKKLIIIALWCIQMKPTDRPSMSKVVEMLEGSVELLQMPPKPFLSSPRGVPEEDYEANTSTS